MPATFLFDLDMTLVNSSAVERYRALRMWKYVFDNLNLILPFNCATGWPAHELPQRLKAQGHQVGVVTSSRQDYAEQLIRQFRIPSDVLVAYEDTVAHKPDPEPITLAMQRLGAEAGRTYYVGNDVIDFEAAYHAGVTSIGVAWCDQNWSEIGPSSPDIMVASPELLLTPKRRRLGYAGDRVFDRHEMVWHAGSLLRFNGLIHGYALGRYFARHDPRHATSGLSAAILELKNSDAPAKQFGDLLGRALDETGVGRDYPYIVPVPPKPGQDRQRLSLVLEQLNAGRVGPNPMPDGLECVRDYGSLKEKKALEREEAVRGAFKTKYKWQGHNVILLDDVMTTGATTAECINTLKRAGAGKVMVLALGKDQKALARKECPHCGRTMKVRTNTKTNEKFWGCSGYPDQCRHTESFD